MKIAFSVEESTGVDFVGVYPPERKDDLYQRVDACIANGGIEAFYDYLLNVDLDGFASVFSPTDDDCRGFDRSWA